MATQQATWDQQDAEALAFELAQAALVAAAVRKASAALTATILVELRTARATAPSGPLPAAAQDRIRRLLADRLPALAVDIEPAVDDVVERAVRLAWRQEADALADLDVPMPDRAGVLAAVLDDPLLKHAGRKTARNLAANVDLAAKAVAETPLRTDVQVRAAVARAVAPVATVERDVRTLTNRAINTATTEIVKAVVPATARLTVEVAPTEEGRAELVPGEPPNTPLQPPAKPTPPPAASPDLRVVWIAERQACLTCKALSGQVADPSTGLWFDEFATFSPRGAPPVWPPDQPLMGPPRHPHCRCRLRVIAASNTMLPAALQREAQRAVLRGWSDHDSRRSRLNAADRLLIRGTNLPKTVKARAAGDVAAGKFSTRHRPRATFLRAD